MESPDISVVVTSFNGERCLEGCLSSIYSQAQGKRVEVLFAGDLSADCLGEIMKKFPDALFLDESRGRTIPGMRALGMLRAKGRIIALLDDHHHPAPGWIDAHLEAHKGAWAALAGAIGIHEGSSRVDTAAFFCEYGRFAPPFKPEETVEIPGTNVSYKREVLSLIKSELEQGLWEPFIHSKLKAEGKKLLLTPEPLVYTVREFGFLEFSFQRFSRAMSFAGMRVSYSGFAKRCAYIFGSPVLPFLLVSRMWKRAKEDNSPDGGRPSLFLKVLPLVFIFMVSWSLGEMAGYLLGRGK